MNKKLVALLTAVAVAVLPMATTSAANAGPKTYSAAVGLYCC